ncbi:MAG: flippase-like domain-containing protein [Clostridiales bacterium]|nr:flippase-like domain-containing protein [Clostridiales bacterium]
MKDESTNTTESMSVDSTDTVSSQNVTEVVIVRDTASVSNAENTSSQLNGQDSNGAQSSRKKRIAKILFTVFFIVAIVGIIVYTAFNDFSGEDVSLARVVEMIGENWYYLLVLLGLFFLTILLEAFKVFLMIRKTTHTYQFGTAFNCASLGKFYDYVTPLGSGGQPFQMYYLAKHGVPSGPASAIPIGTLFLTQFSFFICAIVSFSFGVSVEIVPLYIQIVAYFGAVFYIAVPLFLVIFSFFPKAGYKVIAWGVKVLTKLRLCKKPEKWIAKGNRAIDNNRTNMAILFKSKRVLIVCTLLSFAYVIAQCSLPYFSLLLFSDALKAKNLVPSWGLWFEVTRITFFIYCAITFVPTPGNSGAADGTFYGLFRNVLIAVAGASFTCMMVWRIFSFYMYLILGLIVLIISKVSDHIKKKNTLKSL